MIHLKDIKKGDDFRNYPWQKLVDAVRRACNITVTPPLEMHQSYAGTVIGINSRAVLAASGQSPYTWHASMAHNKSVSSVDAGAPSVATFDTEDADAKQGDIWSLASNILTISASGLFRFNARLPYVFTSPTAALGEVVAWLQYNIGAGWVDVPNSGGVVSVMGSVAAQFHGMIILDSPVLVAADTQYRIASIITQNGLGSPDLLGNDDTSFPSMSSRVISAEWTVQAIGPVGT